MNLLDYFKTAKSKSALIAKERLQMIIVSSGHRNKPSYLPKLQKELLMVVKKYVNIDQNSVSVKHERNKSSEMLELNISLPECTKKHF